MFFKIQNSNSNNTLHTHNTSNTNLITFSTCWYQVKSKFPEKKYIEWIKNLLSIVNNFNLVIYTDITSLIGIIKIIDLKNDKIKIIIKPMESFYTYKYKDLWIKNHEQSTMLLHKHISWKLNMLWNEKIFFVQETLQKRYFNTPYYGWCDIGYFRNEIDNIHTHYLKNWPNNAKLYKYPFKSNENYIHYGCVQNDNVKYACLLNDIKDHYKSNLKTPPTNKYSEICFAGGFFIISPNLINYYAKLYDEKLAYYFSNNYFIKDDQTIIQDIVFTNSNLFYIHAEDDKRYNNWFMFQRLLL
jgi:hypothetical protein